MENLIINHENTNCLVLTSLLKEGIVHKYCDNFEEWTKQGWKFYFEVKDNVMYSVMTGDFPHGTEKNECVTDIHIVDAVCKNIAYKESLKNQKKMKVQKNKFFASKGRDLSKLIEQYQTDLINNGFVVTQDDTMELQYKVCEEQDHIEVYNVRNGVRNLYDCYDVLDTKVQYAIMGMVEIQDVRMFGVCATSNTFENALQLMKAVQNFKDTHPTKVLSDETFGGFRKRVLTEYGFKLSYKSSCNLFRLRQTGENLYVLTEKNNLSHIQKIISIR